MARYVTTKVPLWRTWQRRSTLRFFHRPSVVLLVTPTKDGCPPWLHTCGSAEPFDECSRQMKSLMFSRWKEVKGVDGHERECSSPMVEGWIPLGRSGYGGLVVRGVWSPAQRQMRQNRQLRIVARHLRRRRRAGT